MAAALYSLTAFVSAFLLFWSQPLMAKALLPLLGGAPAVWNTALMFFQIALLAGYAYAHILARFGRRTQAMVHGTLLLAAAFMLPFGNTAGLTPPRDTSPVLWLVATLAITVGLPFFAVSASAPLLQSWFKGTGHKDAGDPYFLYAASNFGSLVALLGFPFVLEPALSVHGQGIGWASIFVLFCALIALCLLRARGLVAVGPTATIAPEFGVWKQRAIWLFLAFVPSSMLLGVTSYVATDLASVPLLWVVPLALYLVTFILAFGGLLPQLGMLRSFMVAALAIIGAFLLYGLLLYGGHAASAAFGTPLHFLCFFVIALGCHAALVARRPVASRLTEFYLWMSAGGALGGIFNALIAPLIFSWTYEYELALVLACAASGFLGTGQKFRPIQVVPPMLLLIIVKISPMLLKSSIPAQQQINAVIFVIGIGAALFVLGRRWPIPFAGGMAGILGGAMLIATTGTLHIDRSFFGVHKVIALDGGKFTALVHGSTIHGIESTDPLHHREPLGYYIAAGPIGQMLAATPDTSAIGVIGLGTGALACYAKPGQSWTFFEIDPSIVRIADDPRYFHFLDACGKGMRMVLGDGRLSLATEPDRKYDILIIDAFSSDAIPMHLLTQDALQLYAAHVKPHGLVVFHISNRYLNLLPSLAATAHAAGLVGMAQTYTASAEQIAAYGASSQWVLLARTTADLTAPAKDPRWETLVDAGHVRAWSDGYSNILDALR